MKAFPLAACLAVPAILAAAPTPSRADLRQMIVRKLALTPAQQDAARQVLKAHNTALRADRAAALQARADLVSALVDPATTPARIQTLESAASAAHLALELEVSQVVKEIAPSLTPAQVAGARELVVEFRSHVQGFRSWFRADGLDQTPAQP